jgi:hypothetical protein
MSHIAFEGTNKRVGEDYLVIFNTGEASATLGLGDELGVIFGEDLKVTFSKVNFAAVVGGVFVRVTEDIITETFVDSLLGKRNLGSTRLAAALVSGFLGGRSIFVDNLLNWSNFGLRRCFELFKSICY